MADFWTQAGIFAFCLLCAFGMRGSPLVLLPGAIIFMQIFAAFKLHLWMMAGLVLGFIIFVFIITCAWVAISEALQPKKPPQMSVKNAVWKEFRDRNQHMPKSHIEKMP
jgi:hypothetical protein